MHPADSFTHALPTCARCGQPLAMTREGVLVRADDVRDHAHADGSAHEGMGVEIDSARAMWSALERMRQGQ